MYRPSCLQNAQNDEFRRHHGFIGCQNYCPNERSHRFLTINRNIKEELLRELLANEGKFMSDVAVESESAVCAQIDENHQVVQAKLIERKCGATIWIFSPLDRTDIVYLSSPHNHPKVPSTKIFGGNIPAAFGLAIDPRIKHRLIQEMKKVKSPYGLGIEEHAEIEIDEYSLDSQEFCFNRRKCDPFRTKNNISGRLCGKWLAHITKSEVKFKFINGEGLGAILVEGNKPQAKMLGTYLVTQNHLDTSGIHETDPKLILLNILQTCIFHLERLDFEQGFNPMALSFDQGLLSAIPEDDWYLTPGDTNLNESARPYTNQHTETTLSLLEAIEREYQMDLQIEAKLRKMGNSCVLINHRNTKVHRDRIYVARRATHYRQALERSISILLSARWTSLFSDNDLGTLVEVKCVLRCFDQNENGVSVLGYHWNHLRHFDLRMGVSLRRTESWNI
ncbi:hypothetical protein C8J57DRAFT_1258823 [Mycena rebaudengoi]|nr:hypothetical protein C8J57DRAFT_1258823 [Mycena rebaudengoi]